ncbi:MAG: hypothetical protein MUF00_16765 [Gemmatimonadaceae bacterium]|jgi:hypothetical protein|nr:hypothetical protein [Gemmatimonadaceae bacterium]
MGLWRDWRDARELARRARAYVDVVLEEPSSRDVQWLAEQSTHGDRARMARELRYAHRAVGLIAAQRDALDDKTASAVAHALSAAMPLVPPVRAAERRDVTREWQSRMRLYGEALAQRGGDGRPMPRLARVLLEVAGATVAPPTLDHATAILDARRVVANEALRKVFGDAALPDDRPPSAVRARVG